VTQTTMHVATGHTAHTKHSKVAHRAAAVEQWVHAHLGCVRHERRVRAIATRLFDLTVPRHGLPRAYRRLLRFGAMLHDVGRAHGPKRHHIRGERMILAERNLPLLPAERQVAAFLTRYHRKSLPARDETRAYTREIRSYALHVLLAILRAADALDSRRVPAKGLTMRLSGRKLQVRCYVSIDPQKAEELFNKRRKFRMLKEVMGVTTEVAIRAYEG